MYVDLLKSPFILNLSLQNDNLDIVDGIKCILKSRKSLMSLAEQAPIEWPMMRLVCARIKEEDDGHVYQGSLLHSYSLTVVQQCTDQVLSDLQQLDTEMRSQL